MLSENRFRSLAAASILALSTLACFHRLAAHPWDVLVGSHDGGRTDIVSAYGAMKTFQRDAVANLRMPYWNPRILCGLPMLGNPQAAMFYPPNWVFLVGEPLHVMSWMLIAHHWFAGFGTYLLAKRYGLTWWSALLAGIVFATAPFLVAASTEGHYNQTCAISWIPWALLAYERLRSGRRHGIPLTASAIAMSFLCGHAQETYYLALVTTGLVVADLLRSDVPGRLIPRVELFKRWSAVGATVVGLVFIDLLPIWFYTKQAVRATGIDVEEASAISLSPANLWQLVDPFALGDAGAYRGTGQFYWETLCYFGTVALMLAVTGCASAWRQASVRRLAILAVVALLFAFGIHTPVFPLLHGYLPGISFFRAPGRALYYCSFAIAMLAGFGTDSIISACLKASRKRSLAAIAGGLGALLLTATAWMARDGVHLSPTMTISITWSLLVASCVLAAGGIVWHKPKWSVGFYAVCILAVLAETTKHAHHITSTISPDDLRTNSEIVEFLANAPGFSRVLASQHAISDREACHGSVSKLGGLEGVPLVRSSLAIVSRLKADEPVSQLMGFGPLDLAAYPRELLDLAGISHAVVMSDKLVEEEEWKLAKQGMIAEEFCLRGRNRRTIPYAIYRRRDPLPRAYLLGGARVQQAGVPIEEQLRMIAPRETVLVDEDALVGGQRLPLTPAEILTDELNRVVVEASCEADGYLVLSDAFCLGWTAEVDGEATSIQPVNFGFRGVPLRPGNHRVVFTFEPPGLRLGALVTGLTLFWIILLSSRSRSEQMSGDIVTPLQEHETTAPSEPPNSP